MLDGIEDLDWAAMHHAYGTAEDVPAMLRGLLDADESVRASAQEDLWGAVHHQGDVYDSTLATIPFLIEIASRRGVAQRTALALLSSYGGVDVSSLLEKGEAIPWQPSGESYWRAASQVAASRAVFMEQLSSADPQVREAAVFACLVGPPDGEVARRLLHLFAEEEDPRTRTSIHAALSWLSRRGLTELDDWVREQEESADPNVRFSAFVEAARRGVMVDTSELLHTIAAVYDQHGPPSAAPRRTRNSRKTPPRRRRAESERRVIPRISTALADPGPLLAELLRSRDWEVAVDAIAPASEHIRMVRGDHAQLVVLIASHFDEAHHDAGRALMVAGPLARPAQHVLVKARIDDNVLATLINLQDSHAIPHLKAELKRPEPGRDVGYRIARLGPVAASLKADILRALREPGEATTGLLQAAAQLQIVDAVPMIVRLLPNEFAIRALRLLGPPARQAAPQLQGLLDSEPKVAVAAAHALWSVVSSRDGLAVILRELESPATGFMYRAAADAAGEIGASEAVEALLAGLEGDDPYGWPQLASARAMWRIEADAAAHPVTRAVRNCWFKNPATRLEVAQLLLEMGQSGGALRDLAHEEAANPLRWTSREGGWSSDDVARDEELLVTLHKFLHGQSNRPQDGS